MLDEDTQAIIATRHLSVKYQTSFPVFNMANDTQKIGAVKGLPDALGCWRSVTNLEVLAVLIPLVNLSFLALRFARYCRGDEEESS